MVFYQHLYPARSVAFVEHLVFVVRLLGFVVTGYRKVGLIFGWWPLFHHQVFILFIANLIGFVYLRTCDLPVGRGALALVEIVHTVWSRRTVGINRVRAYPASHREVRITLYRGSQLELVELWRLVLRREDITCLWNRILEDLGPVNSDSEVFDQHPSQQLPNRRWYLGCLRDGKILLV